MKLVFNPDLPVVRFDENGDVSNEKELFPVFKPDKVERIKRYGQSSGSISAKQTIKAWVELETPVYSNGKIFYGEVNVCLNLMANENQSSGWGSDSLTINPNENSRFIVMSYSVSFGPVTKEINDLRLEEYSKFLEE